MGFDCNLGNGIHKYLGMEYGILYHEKNGGCNLGFSGKRSWNAGISAKTTSKTERLQL